MKSAYQRNIFFLLFTLSGFTGLIYESIWSHYLKLFLGHAAYAQALVLGIFMGGMALGAWLASKWTYKWKNLLLIYAIVELFIGLFGICFHPVFKMVLDLSYNLIIPGLSSPAFVQIYKWSLASILILPQSVLLGMTFPLMSTGIIRLFPVTPGKSLSILYFTNSIGAAIGVLVSGFVLISAVGLPGTILFAGILNILLAIIVYRLAKNQSASIVPEPDIARSIAPGFLLVAAFITGMASFIYEITWIRMLNMVLGTSTHAFELMLSAFITGLAFGSLWIRKHIDHFKNLIQTSGYIQILMGVLALCTIPLYNHTFTLMEFLTNAMNRTEQGYILFTLNEHLIALLVMLPTTFFAGMTLPLFSFILLKQGHGERSIGQIYASNTLGAIFGVIFTIFIGFPYLGLKGSILFGSSLDIFLGIGFIAASISINKTRTVILNTIVYLVLLLTISLGTRFDTVKMASGIYRKGTTYAETIPDILFYRDGRTASITVTESSNIRSLKTNGKTDVTINMFDRNQPAIDEGTMVLLGGLPVIFRPEAKTVANIGMGSGLTAHAALAWPKIQTLDTIEIEPMVIEAAGLFRPRVDRIFTDPRSNIYVEDAKTFFSTHQKKYDVIISEPSNPWVSGVSSLFTDEFYEHILSHLNDNGLFVQWLQLYEINDKLSLSILKAISNHFHDFRIFSSNDYDLIIVASKDKIISEPNDMVFSVDEFAKELEFIGIKGIQDIYARYLGNKKLYGPYLTGKNILVNSDYFPIVDLGAARTMFMADTVTLFTSLKTSPIPILPVLIMPEIIFDKTEITADQYSFITLKASRAKKLHEQFTMPDPEIDTDFLKYSILTKPENACSSKNNSVWIDNLILVMGSTLPYLQPGEISEISDSLNLECIDYPVSNHDDWLNLYTALGMRDAIKINEITNKLLQDTKQWPVQQIRFLLIVKFLSLIVLEDYASVISYWDHYINKILENDMRFIYETLFEFANFHSRPGE